MLWRTSVTPTNGERTIVERTIDVVPKFVRGGNKKILHAARAIPILLRPSKIILPLSL